ncbi:MAG: hypothetical protein FD187_2728 [bacterium]|nr:MAG: hypothetical protein FD142_3006 [bacterium]KAF0147508.1 MAG: hypothetical protein FD187_2728 [bacterium]KAF0165680.1 MAG: hypothetical protein FD158_2844 [bacterium]TXT19296.1 MAG: hypothetical protein FD132_1806 [bacterium]
MRVRDLCLTLGIALLAWVPAARALDAGQVALLVNRDDPASVEIAVYYRQRRGIPEANVIELAMPTGRDVLSGDEFEQIHAEAKRRLPPGTRALVLAWTRPWRAGCMSITSAFAFGFDKRFCSSGCGQTSPSRYFNGGLDIPDSLPMPIPAMMLAGESVDQVKQLIDRGIASDYTYPRGTVYLVRTEDAARNVRARHFDAIPEQVPGLRMASPSAAQAKGLDDVLGYFTGAARVPLLDTLTFLPGAPADHLTSFGGQLLGNPSQMSALEWLKAGATASYGTVVEPCNHLSKFPHPGVLMHWYANGDTLIEAYWKSVAAPGEGVFIGEPLARPFGTRVQRDEQGWWLEGHSGKGRRVVIETAPSVVGPYRPATSVKLPAGHSRQKLTVEKAAAVRARSF